MCEIGIRSRARRKFKATTDSKHALPVAANVLDRRFEVDQPDKAWVTDITYIWTAEGWLYLAAILDLFSRRVVGFAMSDRIDRRLALAALASAAGQRQPRVQLIHHSDRGSQYASGDYQAALRALGLTCSMSAGRTSATAFEERDAAREGVIVEPVRNLEHVAGAEQHRHRLAPRRALGADAHRQQRRRPAHRHRLVRRLELLLRTTSPCPVVTR